LLAEDDPDDAEQTKTTLRGAGVLNRIVLVTDGDEAIAYYLKGEGNLFGSTEISYPGILLLDLKCRAWTVFAFCPGSFFKRAGKAHGDRIERAW